MAKKQVAAMFYRDLMDLFLRKKVKFLVGGTYAFTVYTGIKRPTKDFDIFTTPDEYPKLLHLCSEDGYSTELLDKAWIAKVHKDGLTADIIFAERNGITKVKPSWFDRAPMGEVLGKKVKLMPAEDMIRSKAYIQVRNRYDGADVLLLMLRKGKDIDWNWLYESMKQDWELLFSYVLLFYFVFPHDKHLIPTWLTDTLEKNFKQQKTSDNKNTKVTKGLLLSPQYAVAVEKWGYQEI